MIESKPFYTMNIIILAGGEGKRMQSTIPKVLHLFHGIPMIVRIVHEALKLSPNFIYIVVGKFRSQIQNALENNFPNRHFLYIDQTVPLGTGHAISQCLPYLPKDQSQILILSGDIPALDSEILKPVLRNSDDKNTILTMKLQKPFGYGRIVRNENGHVVKIVEEKDANDSEKNISQVNTGIYVFQCNVLKTIVPQIKNCNAQAEYYLTDIVELCSKNNIEIDSYLLENSLIKHIQGVNTQDELKNLEKLIKL